MKAEELRIGNWVYDPSRKIQSKIIRLDIEITLDLQPIPLTEDWLLKLGFNDPEWSELKTEGGIIEIADSKFSVHSGLGDASSYGCNVNIQYVHQLQNLYYALTGIELSA